MQPPTVPDAEPPVSGDFQHADADSSSCPRRLILIGASVRAAAQSARRAGFAVIGVDRFGDTDTLAACDRYYSLDQPPGMLRDQLAPFADGAVMQAGGLGSLGRTVDAHLSRHQWLGASQQQATELRTTSFLHKLAIDCDVRFPMTTADISRLAGGGANRWLRKRTVSCGGLGVQRADSNDAAAPEFLFQQWIAGRNFGVSFLSDGDQVVMLGACRSLHTRVGSCPFVYAGSYGPITLAPETSRSLCRLGCELVARTGLRGLFNVDVIIDAAGVLWLLEVNPRWSGSSEIIERALVSSGRLAEHQSLIGLGYQASLDSLSAATLELLSDNGCSGTTFLKRIVFTRRSGWYHSIDVASPTVALADVPRDGTPINCGEPIVTLLAAIDANGRPKWREISGAYRRLRGGSLAVGG